MSWRARAREQDVLQFHQSGHLLVPLEEALEAQKSGYWGNCWLLWSSTGDPGDPCVQLVGRKPKGQDRKILGHWPGRGPYDLLPARYRMDHPWTRGGCDGRWRCRKP